MYTIKEERNNPKKPYWICRVDDGISHWHRMMDTTVGILRYLELERRKCDYSQHIFAVEEIYRTKYGWLAGYDVESGLHCFVPDDAEGDLH